MIFAGCVRRVMIRSQRREVRRKTRVWDIILVRRERASW